MGAQATPRAVLLDALGTLVRLEPPAPRLRRALRAELDLDVSEDVAEAAMRAEIAFYRAHMDVARDAVGLAELRLACAGVVRDHLPAEAADAPLERVRAALIDALVFTPYREVVATLARLRNEHVRLVVVSNWDVSLHEVLARTGLDVLVDGAVASAEIGASKPDPAIFTHGLAIAGVRPEQAWHAGDTWDADVVGARRTGVRPVLVDREAGADSQRDGVPVLRSLSGLRALMSSAG